MFFWSCQSVPQKMSNEWNFSFFFGQFVAFVFLSALTKYVSVKQEEHACKCEAILTALFIRAAADKPTIDFTEDDQKAYLQRIEVCARRLASVKQEAYWRHDANTVRQAVDDEFLHLVSSELEKY